ATGRSQTKNRIRVCSPLRGIGGGLSLSTDASDQCLRAASIERWRRLSGLCSFDRPLTPILKYEPRGEHQIVVVGVELRGSDLFAGAKEDRWAARRILGMKLELAERGAW